MIYDPLLDKTKHAVTVAPVTDSLVSSVQVLDNRFDVVVEDTPMQVLVDGNDVTVVSAGEMGPQGPQGIQGLPGSPRTAVAPLEIPEATTQIRIIPGTSNGHGLIWSGTAWENQQVIPSGAAGTVPFTSESGFSGDAVNFQYDASQQALRVTKLDAALLDGGNF